MPYHLLLTLDLCLANDGSLMANARNGIENCLSFELLLLQG